MAFHQIEKAAKRASPQFDALHGSPENNCAVLKEMAIDMMRALSALVEEAGGDADYIESYVDGIADDLDRAFGDKIEFGSEPDYADVFKPRAGLLGLIVRGANLQAAE